MVFSIISLIITAANVFWFGSFGPEVATGLLGLNVFNALIASGLAAVGVAKFTGVRQVPNPKLGHPPIWSLGRAFNMVTLIAAVGAMLLPIGRLIGW